MRERERENRFSGDKGKLEGGGVTARGNSTSEKSFYGEGSSIFGDRRSRRRKSVCGKGRSFCGRRNNFCRIGDSEGEGS